jgi:hypothetical protein
MDWHRLLGLLLTDFFTGSPFVVEVERDLSVQRQWLDLVILRKRKGRFAERLPDGLNDLVAHNLVTFKSHQEALDDWAMKELIGHYVSYRKLVSPSPEELLPEEQFRLYAVCSRYPHNLAGAVTLTPVQQGVYHCRWGTDIIRVVVVRQLPEAEHNAPLHLFSGSAEQVAYGARHYRQRSEETSTLLRQLFEGYQGEGLVMPYTMADFRRDYVKEHFKDLAPEEIQSVLRGLPAKQRREALEGLQVEDRLAGLSPEDRLAGLSPEDRLAGLSPEEIEKLLNKLKAEGASRPRRRRRKD